MDNTSSNQSAQAAPAMPPIATPQGATPAQPNATTDQLKHPTDHSDLIKTIVIVALSLVAATFIGLFIWMLISYNDAKTDLDIKIDKAVIEAVDKKTDELEAEFAEREKDPYKTFAGPADYGELSFKYPKTWSVYVNKDASNGGDFEAYMNPGEVNTVSPKTLNSLHVTIRDKSYDEVVTEYQRYMERKEYNLKMELITVNGTTANRYSGTIPNTEFNGIVVIFKIRDKTAILQTDSVLFEGDFNTLIETINFNA